MDLSQRTRSINWSFAWPWLLGFGLTVYLGMRGGGYDVLVSGQVGVAIWWVLLLAIAIGAAPVRRPGPLGLAALAIFAAFAGWTALSLHWTESTEKTATDVALAVTVLGAFALALVTRGRDGARQMVSAIAAGITVIALVALLSRLHPGLFPNSQETGNLLFTGKERLSYPLDYWNGLAALISIGLPLLLQLATGARLRAIRVVAAAVMPAVFLALYMTLSRNGIAGGLIALAIYLAFVPDRLPKALTLGLTGVGGGILILLSSHRSELIHGLAEATARSQGNEIFWFTVVVCVLAGIAEFAIIVAPRPGWLRVSRRQSQVALGAAVLVVIVGFFAIDGPHHLSHSWDDFKKPATGSEHGTSRLTSAGGEDRYQLWSSAVREFDSAPLIGTGANTFQLWWTRDGTVELAVLDTHNLYLQEMGELGLIGILLMAAFIGTTLIGGGVRLLRAGPTRRAWLAAALAGSTVLWTTSTFDWMWKIPVLPIVTVLLAAVVITAGDPEPDEERSPALIPPLRVAVAVVAVAALVAIAIPLAGEQLLRDSQDHARRGELPAAMEDARSAQNAQPGAAAPRIQEALLYEGAGEFGPAEEAALAATSREPNDWHNWLILSRIQARNEKPDPAVASYRRARSLNPHSSLFTR